MQTIKRFLNFFSDTFRKQGKIGKAVISVISLLFLCCLCSLPLSLFSPSVPSSQRAPDIIDVSSIQTAAVNTLVVGINQTITANAPTDNPLPIFTQTLAFTETPLITPTLIFTPTITNTPQATLPAGVASCIPNNPQETAKVVEIVDGDTIRVLLNDLVYSVRYIGVDAPETGKEYYGLAAQLNQNLVYSRMVTLIKDTSDKDNKGFLLRYVIVDDVFVNLEIIKQGYAQAVSIAPDTACSTIFSDAQSQAQTAAIGIWVPTLVPYFPPASNPTSSSPSRVCCKYCGPNSKACGDSCISLSYTCHKPPGCACD